ncbi:MAG TPA: hypothetical protein VM123_04130 [archaeon]|nr:hypothetical protein [archaeon]
MNTPLVTIQQSDKEVGWGKLGAVMPKGDKGAQLTLNDVHMAEGVEFEISGPFRVTVEEKRFEKCTPVNFRNLRPGCDYDRVIFETDLKPRLR